MVDEPLEREIYDVTIQKAMNDNYVDVIISNATTSLYGNWKNDFLKDGKWRKLVIFNCDTIS